ncbi:MAG: hypothetical protein IJQ10_01445 [Clostridia bacterium]|nr:hypothetical protein [Clostridia bacterium]
MASINDVIRNLNNGQKGKECGKSIIKIISNSINNAFYYLELYLDEQFKTKPKNEDSITYKYYLQFKKNISTFKSKIEFLEGSWYKKEALDNLINFAKENKQGKFGAFFKKSRICKIAEIAESVSKNLEDLKNQSHLDKIVKYHKLQHPITNQEIEIIDPDKNQNSAEIIGNFYGYNGNEIENLYTQLN